MSDLDSYIEAKLADPEFRREWIKQLTEERDEARELARCYHRAWKKKRLISTDFPEDRYHWLTTAEPAAAPEGEG